MSDAEYLIRRAQEELQAAMGAADERVREVHLELADAYTFRLQETLRLERRAASEPSLQPDSAARDSRSAFNWAALRRSILESSTSS
jgi:hypothetical protein